MPKTYETVQHTPGPWHVNAIDSKRGRIVGDETTTEPYDKLQIHAANRTIATIYRPTDARLIAAAPELLAALQEIKLCCCARPDQFAPVAGCDCWACLTATNIRAAIRKATGG